MNIALVCIAKMEELYINEFINYYAGLGIDHIYIVDNNDTGYSPSLHEVLKDNEHFQNVTLVDGYHGALRFQIKSYNAIYKSISDKYDWVCFFDVDELLCIKNGLSIKDFLSQPCFKNINQIAIPWVVYDDNDLLHYDNRPLMQRFTRKSKNASKSFKSIYRTQLDVNISIHTGHFKDESQCRVADANGNVDCIEQQTNKYGKTEYWFKNDIDSQMAHLKHFRFKTIEEYISRKVRRGRPCVNEKNYWLTQNTNEQLLMTFFRHNNYTDEKMQIGTALLEQIRSNLTDHNL